MLKECVKGNYYARFHTHIYHCFRERHFIFTRHKILTKSVCHGACSKCVSRAIIMQDFILTAITVTEKGTLFLDVKF